MKLKIFLFLLTLTAPIVLMAGSSPMQDQFNMANQHVEKGETDQAFDLYNSLIKQGFGGASLYYNLGNLYYRKGERGNAVLWYERALKYAPRDADIQFNLSLARSHLKDDNSQWIERLIFYFTNNELAVATSIFVWIFFILLGSLILGWVQSEIWPTALLWTTCLLLVVCGGWLIVNSIWDNKPYAIVTKLPGEVRNGPGIDYAVGFTIPEGSRVLILNRRPEWSQIGVEKQGLKGWIPSAEIEPIRITGVLSN